MALNMQTPPVGAKVTSLESVYRAVKDLEALIMDPPVERDRIFMGFGNDLSLPADSNEYVVNTVIDHIQRGTPVVDYQVDEESGELRPVVRKVNVLVVQVDCYSDDPESARLRAMSIEALMRTTPGADFFAQYGLSSLYAEPVKNTTVVVDADKYVQRSTVVIHVGYVHWMVLDFKSHGFDAVGVRVRNVDTL